MTIKVIHKLTRTDTSVNWYNWADNGYEDIPGRISKEEPDDLTLIITRSWPDLDTHTTTIGDYDASSNSTWKPRSLARGTYNELNNITTIRYIYDADDNLTTTQKQVNKVYWEDYSE